MDNVRESETDADALKFLNSVVSSLFDNIKKEPKKYVKFRYTSIKLVYPITGNFFVSLTR